MPNLSILWKAVAFPHNMFASSYVVDQNNNSIKHFPFLNDFDFNFVNKNIPNIINFDYQIISVPLFNILKMSYSKNFDLIRSQHSNYRSQRNFIIIFGRNNNSGWNLTIKILQRVNLQHYYLRAWKTNALNKEEHAIVILADEPEGF